MAYDNNIFDSRVLKYVGMSKDGVSGADISHIPYGISSTGSFINDYFETEESVRISAEERREEMHAAAKIQTAEEFKEEWGAESSEEVDRSIDDWITERIAEIQRLKELMKNMDMVASYSMIHPYAIVKLAGGYGDKNIQTLVDKSSRRRWYEIDGDDIGGYAKNPTTTAIINWGAQDQRGRFPYSYTDFVFCKYWNKIQNNRMITLRRYPQPVPDSVEPSNYNVSETGDIATSPKPSSSEPFAPLCTAVTFFGEGTDNTLSDILSFSIGYEWEEIKGDVWQTTSSQPEEGQVVNSNNSYISGALMSISKALGILGDLSGKGQIVPIHAAGMPPDPYHDGPYENRILGPMNVINNVYKRKRGLTFSQEGLTITFEYVSRPIANVNNKAIMLDLLSNYLLMTSSSGTFFGGLHRYRTEHPAVYPWRNTDILSNLYKGKLFGKNGAIKQTLDMTFSPDNFSFVGNFLKDIVSSIGNIASNILNKITGGVLGNKSEDNNEEDKKTLRERAAEARGTAGRAIAAKYLKGATVPWLMHAKALLTGAPVGDWHLTIGNPLNPIAMIGNLIVDHSEITFSDELGPDDFPIGFKAKITLKHGMGRDKDAVESMFNRGYGRIYTLPDSFKSSADKQTMVDAATTKDQGNTSMQVSQWGGIQTTGSDSITAIANYRLSNHGVAYDGTLKHYNLDLSTLGQNFFSNGYGQSYIVTPWSTHYIL